MNFTHSYVGNESFQSLTYMNMGQLYVILVIHTVVEAEKLKQVNIFISSLESIFITDTMNLPNGGTIIHGPI